MKFFKGSPEAFAWAKTQQKKKASVRAAGLKAEQQFFGPGGEFDDEARAKTRTNPRPPEPHFTSWGQFVAYIGQEGWKPLGKKNVNAFGRTVGSLYQILQLEARAWRVLYRTFLTAGASPALSLGTYKMLDQALIAANRQANDFLGKKKNPSAPGGYQGRAIIGVDDPVYNTQQKFPKYSGKISPLSAHGTDGVKMLIRRLPQFKKSDHDYHAQAHEQSAMGLNEQYQDLITDEEKRLKRRGQDPGPLISGIVSQHFPETVKTRLRQLATWITKHRTVAWLHRQAARSRMTKNPITLNSPKETCAKVSGVMYNRVREVKAEKTGNTQHKGLWYHPYKKGSQVQMLALDTGDILLHSKTGKALWRED